MSATSRRIRWFPSYSFVVTATLPVARCQERIREAIKDPGFAERLFESTDKLIGEMHGLQFVARPLAGLFGGRERARIFGTVEADPESPDRTIIRVSIDPPIGPWVGAVVAPIGFVAWAGAQSGAWNFLYFVGALAFGLFLASSFQIGDGTRLQSVVERIVAE